MLKLIYKIRLKYLDGSRVFAFKLLPALVVVVPVDLEDIHDILVGLRVEKERLVRLGDNYPVQVPMAL